MKVLHIIDSGGLYGAEVMLLNLIREQAKMGLEPILASIGEHSIREKPVETEAARLGLRVRIFRMLPGPNPVGALAILRYAWRERVDLLHSHGYKGNIFFGMLPRFVRRLPLVSTVHGWTWIGGINRMMLYEGLDALSLSGADRIVLVSDQMKHHPRLRGISPLNIAVVENGIPDITDEDDAELDKQIVDFCRQGITIGAIGRLSPEKGFDLLLQAVSEMTKEFSEVRLVIFGDGGLRADLEKRAEYLGIARRLLMPGFRKNARCYLPCFQLFVIPSRTEGLPMTLLEAMQAKVPIVASRVGGMPTVLADGGCGVLVESNDVSALKNALSEILNNRESTAQKVEFAFNRVREFYSSRAMANKYTAVYKSVCGQYRNSTVELP